MQNILWRGLQTEARYFLPDENFYAFHSFSNAPPPFSAAVLCPSCPPFTIQLHFCHFTSSIPSYYTRKTKQTHMYIHLCALRCSFSSTYWRPKKMSAWGSKSPPSVLSTLCSLVHAQRWPIPLTTLYFSRLRDMTNLCGFRTADQTSCTLPRWNGNYSLDCGRNLCFS